MRVRDVMKVPAVSVAADAPLVVARALLEHHGLSHVPVMNGTAVVGLISREHLRRDRGTLTGSVAEHASVPATTVCADTPLAQAVRVMRAHRLGCVPVLVGTTLVGILAL
jgi:CBS domain-containing protein